MSGQEVSNVREVEIPMNGEIEIQLSKAFADFALEAQGEYTSVEFAEMVELGHLYWKKLTEGKAGMTNVHYLIKVVEKSDGRVDVSRLVSLLTANTVEYVNNIRDKNMRNIAIAMGYSK